MNHEGLTLTTQRRVKSPPPNCLKASIDAAFDFSIRTRTIAVLDCSERRPSGQAACMHGINAYKIWIFQPLHCTYVDYSVIYNETLFFFLGVFFR